MRDPMTFESRLADALGRYADLGPVVDDAEIARHVITAGRSRWPAARPRGWFGFIWPTRLRAAHLLLLLALLAASLIVGIAVGALRLESPRPLGSNGAIAFYVQGSNRSGNHSESMDSDGSGSSRSLPGACPTYSPDGRFVTWFSGDAPISELVVERVDGATSTRVPMAPDYSYDSFRPSYALSPDGTRVAWMKPIREIRVEHADGSSEGEGSANELWVTPLDGRPATRIVRVSEDRNESYSPPSWSPDGRHIAFSGHVADFSIRPSHRSAIYLVDVDGSRVRRLTTRPAVGAEGVSWSPDGRFIAYTGLPDGTALPESDSPDPPFTDPPLDIFVIGADGTGDRNLTVSPAFENRPDWSPDGRRLAFHVSTNGERDRIATIRMDGATPLGQPTAGPRSDWFVWSPDGSELLWLDTTSSGPGATTSTFHTIDPDFARPSETLRSVDGVILCKPSWQRVEP